MKTISPVRAARRTPGASFAARPEAEQILEAGGVRPPNMPEAL